MSARVETWTSPAFLAWAIITAASTAYLLRGIQRFLHPGFWAEDGRNFFADAFNQGIASIFEPYNGYLHVIPRLVALPMSAAPLSTAPALFAVSAAVMYLVMISPVLSDRIAWLIPTKVARSIAYLLLCLLPVMNEVYGSTANLIFIGGITLFLFVISDDPTTRGGRAAELVAMTLLGLSGPLMVLFVPFFAYRWWCRRSGHSLLVGVTAAMTAAIQLAIYLCSSRSETGDASIVTFAKVIVYRVGGGWLYGTDDVVVDGSHTWAQVNCAVWIVAVVTVCLLASPKIVIPLGVLVGILLLAPTLAYGDVFLGNGQNLQRHLIVPLSVAIILLVAAASTDLRSWVRSIAAGCLVIGVGAMVGFFFQDSYPLQPDMGSLVECFDGGQATCTIPTLPAGWTIELKKQ
ncbi:hypothetical protein [Rhodococcus qingshengii]|uniref:hypothetical protein n=1 Tax=Rhodococcus qingshengii TaxID=334542 RepID=UPI00117A5875|nr:hypothetical protein [Rhodococcus qingshengii]